MNSQDDKRYKIKAIHIGPIMDLDDVLSGENQNLIFARNGTGKSFLSRAFRYIAEYKNKENSQNLSNNEDSKSLAELLVSTESLDNSAEFIFFHDIKKLAKIKIDNQNKNPIPEIDLQTIFHVFSQDFVDEELRQEEYKLDGNITHKIIVGSKNIELDEARKDYEKAITSHIAQKKLLTDIFDKEKISELKDKAGINAGLAKYKNIFIEPYLTQELSSEESETNKPLREIIKELNELKLINDDLTLPDNLEPLLLNKTLHAQIQNDLEKIISPSSVAGNMKKELDANPDFYKIGIELIGEKIEICPLCKQSLEKKEVKEIIFEYITYFKNEEAKAKDQLREHYKNIKNKINDIIIHEQNKNQQEKLFNDIKHHIPSQKDISFENMNEEYKQIIYILKEQKDIIEVKGKDLSIFCKLPDNNLENIIDRLNVKIKDSNKKINEIRKICDNTNTERRELQGLACDTFLTEFIKNNETKINAIRFMKLDLEEQVNKINKLESAGDSGDAKVRVAATLQILLLHFFDKTYSFDKENFTIKINNKIMPARGSHRTLSDGEKAVLAFCYFIAMIHLKVQSNGDYKKLFLIFDDPVTSMSYDFVFDIVQALKNLGISKEGEISIKLKQANNNFIRPRLLVLTHNSYFFNVASTNGVVKSNAAFSLNITDDKHKLSKMSDYIAPFREQLKDIILMADGKKPPNHTTANLIRSVLEAIQRFCHPDKNLIDFFGYIVQEKGLNIKSTLINNFSHGHYGDETPTPDDLKQACKEAVKIALEFIPGQVYKIDPQKRK